MKAGLSQIPKAFLFRIPSNLASSRPSQVSQRHRSSGTVQLGFSEGPVGVHRLGIPKHDLRPCRWSLGPCGVMDGWLAGFVVAVSVCPRAGGEISWPRTNQGSGGGYEEVRAARTAVGSGCLGEQAVSRRR